MRIAYAHEGKPLDCKMSRKVRCGVIGAGWWATYAHIPALLQHPNAELVAIQKRKLDDALKVARHFGIPRAYGSAEALIAENQLDAVVVASSPNMHYEHARLALANGLHVLVEKPMTITAAEARELVSLAAEHGKQLIISCPWHYTHHGQDAQRLISSGQLGDVRMITMLMTNPVADLIRGASTDATHSQDKPYLEPRPGTYSDPEIAGGGQIYTQVSHAAAYLTFLTGVRPAQVFARFHNDGSRMDIYDALNIELENGCLVSMASTGATPINRRDFEVRVYGTRGILFLELWRGCMDLVPLDGSAPEDFPPLVPDEVYPERAPAKNLIDSIMEASANLSPGSLGLAAMEVIEAACTSASSGQNISIRSLRESAA
jgi:predicted dehydrogenase